MVFVRQTIPLSCSPYNSASNDILNISFGCFLVNIIKLRTEVLTSYATIIYYTEYYIFHVFGGLSISHQNYNCNTISKSLAAIKITGNKSQLTHSISSFYFMNLPLCCKQQVFLQSFVLVCVNRKQLLRGFEYLFSVSVTSAKILCVSPQIII